jgi:predicted membrane channel-forming protein YqfA (hemolysin III family)
MAFPARNLNEACSWLDFFDNHDIWHLLSSTALFCTFICLLTIDDDLLFVPRDKIPVF